MINIPKYAKPSTSKSGPRLMSPLDAKRYGAGQLGVDTKGLYKDGYLVNTTENKKKLKKIQDNIKKVMTGEGY